MANATGGIELEGRRIWKRPNSQSRRSTCATRLPPSACFHLSAALHPDLIHEGVTDKRQGRFVLDEGCPGNEAAAS